MTRSATGASRHCIVPGTRYAYLSNQPPHRRITVPPEKLAILPGNGSDKTGRKSKMFTLSFSYFFLSPRTLLLYFKSHLILFSVLLTILITSLRKKHLIKTSLKSKTLNLFFLFSFQFLIPLGKSKRPVGVMSPRPCYRLCTPYRDNGTNEQSKLGHREQSIEFS